MVFFVLFFYKCMLQENVITCSSLLGFLVLPLSDPRSDFMNNGVTMLCDLPLSFKVYFCLVLPYRSAALLDTRSFFFPKHM